MGFMGKVEFTPLVVLGKNAGIVVEDGIFIFRNFDPKFGFKSVKSIK
jgi:hypothetical protein